MLRLASRPAPQPGSRRVPGVLSWWLTGLLCGTLLMLAGCSRSFWRQNADDNTYAIMRDKSADPRWEQPRLDLNADPRSRFYDPYDPDCEPLPPDDPSAHAYMHWMGRNMNTGYAKVDQPWTGGVLPPWLYPQKPIRGWKSWHNFGDTLTVENPQWLEPFGLTAEQLAEQKKLGVPEGPGIADLTMAQAIELSYIHSRDYQLALETVYSSALALTFERFRFDVRYLGLGGRKPSASLTRTQANGVESTTLNQRLGISQLLPTGGQYIVEMANNTLWLFTGGNQSSTATTLSYSLVQPLLLGAGRQVILESLTQAERQSLYDMRTFQRFRQTFFVNTVSAGTSGGGYYGLLQNYQTILNTRFQIKLLELNAVRQQVVSMEPVPELKVPLGPIPVARKAELSNIIKGLPDRFANILTYDDFLDELRWRLDSGDGKTTPFRDVDLRELKQLITNPTLLEALDEMFAIGAAGDAVSLSVAQLLTSLAQQRSNLLSQEQSFQNTLDAYKFQLGLPPDLWMTINIDQLKPFQLISPELVALEDEAFKFNERIAVLPEDKLVSPELEAAARDLEDITLRALRLGVGLLDADRERVQQNKGKRFAELAPTFDAAYRKSILDDYDRDERLVEIARVELNKSAKRLANLREQMARSAKGEKAIPDEEQKPDAEKKPEEKPEDGKAEVDVPPNQKGQPEREIPVKELSAVLEQVTKVVRNMQGTQVNLRVELIGLNGFDMKIDEAVQSGLENRVDLMNQRAIVMDARRKMEVAANTLRSQLDVTAAGDINTVPLGSGNTSPFEFRRDQSSFRLGIAFTAPLDQVQQRNTYRQTLITYQQARRAYMQAEDQVKISIRNSWRAINTQKQTFEITRRNVRLAAMQYDQAVEASLAPTAAGGGGGGGGNSNSGLNLIQALQSVLSAQNSLIQFWVNYEVNRLNIHRDMGIMQLDERGVWIDDYYQQIVGAPPVTADTDQNTEGSDEPLAIPTEPLPPLPPATPTSP